MKSYRELVALLEARHGIKYYGDWGIVSRDGVHDGKSHPTAVMHTQLADSLDKDLYDVAHYFHDKKDDTLNIRTHTRESLVAAINHFESLPHTKSGQVYHEHFTNYDDDDTVLTGSHSGNLRKCLASMKAFLKAQDEEKGGDWW